MPIVTRKIEFDAGHRLVGHESKCRHLHGHRYVAEITVMADKLDSVGRVVDFSVIKDRIGGWIDDNWDHNMILNSLDPMLNATPKEWLFADRAPYLMHENNPTAENMAMYLLRIARTLITAQDRLAVIAVRLYETPNCWADARLEDL